MLRYALAALFGLFLAGCATFAPHQQDALSVVTCAADSPMVADALQRGEPALAELAADLNGMIEAIKAGEDLTEVQLATLVQLERTLVEVRACLE